MRNDETKVEFCFPFVVKMKKKKHIQNEQTFISKSNLELNCHHETVTWNAFWIDLTTAVPLWFET